MPALLVTCPRLNAPYLRREVERLGYDVVEEFVTGIRIEGTMIDAMRLNLWLRTGYRVLYHLADSYARDGRDLYREASRIPWEEWIPARGFVSVTSSVDTPSVRDSRFPNMKLKDAIVDRISSRQGERPDSGPELDGAVVFLRWKGTRCSFWLDTSGPPLTKRGYRRIPWKAPMHEALGATLLMATQWTPELPLVNPMCGSGTLAIEAALMASKQAPGLTRSGFAFMNLRGFEKDTWNDMIDEARAARLQSIGIPIIASDHAARAIEAARENARAAGVEKFIEFIRCDFSDTPVPEAPGVIILNPEYGARLGDHRALENVYTAIGDFFKQKCAGYTGYIFTGAADLAKRVGLRTRRRIPFFNSTIECRLLEYEMYTGSRE